jgi:thioredoxin 1
MNIRLMILVPLAFTIGISQCSNQIVVKPLNQLMQNTHKSSQDAFKDIITSNKFVVVKFFAEWCGPCKQMKNTVEQVAKDLQNTITFIEVDIDKFKHLVSSYNIQAIPTLLLFSNGNQLYKSTITGPMTPTALKTKLKESFNL